jgi:hypothetical protein
VGATDAATGPNSRFNAMEPTGERLILIRRPSISIRDRQSLSRSRTNRRRRGPPTSLHGQPQLPPSGRRLHHDELRATGEALRGSARDRRRHARLPADSARYRRPRAATAFPHARLDQRDSAPPAGNHGQQFDARFREHVGAGPRLLNGLRNVAGLVRCQLDDWCRRRPHRDAADGRQVNRAARPLPRARCHRPGSTQRSAGGRKLGAHVAQCARCSAHAAADL